MKPAVPGFAEAFGKKEKKMLKGKMKTMAKLSDNVVTALFYHMSGCVNVFLIFPVLTNRRLRRWIYNERK